MRLSFLANRLDPVRLAFDPDQTPLPPSKDRPFEGPLPWYEELSHAVLPAPPEADEALAWADYRHFRALRESRRQTVRALRLFLLMNQPGAYGKWHSSLAETAIVSGKVLPLPSRGIEGEFRALPLLTLRAAWRAIVANPDHPDGYLGLFRAPRIPNFP